MNGAELRFLRFGVGTSGERADIPIRALQQCRGIALGAGPASCTSRGGCQATGPRRQLEQCCGCGTGSAQGCPKRDAIDTAASRGYCYAMTSKLRSGGAEARCGEWVSQHAGGQVFPGGAGSRSKFLSLLRNPALAALLFLGVVTSSGQAQTGTVYWLNRDSTFEKGCFAPCLCPVLVGAAVKGTFVLTPTGFDGLFNTYAVEDVRWLVSIGGTNTLVTGQGTYKLGGEVALQQELSLYLQVGGATVEHFDSGLVPVLTQFPDIKATISTNGQVCFDTVFGVSASPVHLTVIPSGTSIILTWPTNATGFTLQSTTNVGSSAVWTTNSPAPVVVNGQFAVTNLLSGPQQFFRLSQ